jgi:putative oxygen-independent coproporphyrinogen III oxidase
LSTPDYGIYVHIPWCRVRCPYCSFVVERDKDVDWDAFVDSVLDEYTLRKADFGPHPKTIYLGGGTPSRMPPRVLRRLLHHLPSPMEPDGEVSLEANPEDVTARWLTNAIESGVNRLSLGIQTFNPGFARLLNRAHTVRQARDTVARVAAADLRSWSVDVIFALPGQTLDDLRVDIQAIIETEPPHVSLYGLTFEANTPYARARQRGQLEPPDDELWREMYDLLVHNLHQARLIRYETSNFACVGHQSEHNSSYWSDRPYMGLGPGAHGYAPDGRRWVNPRGIRPPGEPVDRGERPEALAQATDLILSTLRFAGGLDLHTLFTKTGFAIPQAAIDPLITNGLAEQHGFRIFLSEAGFPLGDAVVRHLTDALKSSG